MYDFIIIGGGILGMSTAMQLKHSYPDSRMLLLDKESGPAQHQTGHNSGVIHAGVYYTPGSLKARFCLQGNKATKAFCQAQGIRFDECGKLLVATNQVEMQRLQVTGAALNQPAASAFARTDSGSMKYSTGRSNNGRTPPTTKTECQSKWAINASAASEPAGHALTYKIQIDPSSNVSTAAVLGAASSTLALPHAPARARLASRMMPAMLPAMARATRSTTILPKKRPRTSEKASGTPSASARIAVAPPM